MSKCHLNVCWLSETIAFREWSPWHAIHPCSRGQKVTIPERIRPLSLILISSMMSCFNGPSARGLLAYTLACKCPQGLERSGDLDGHAMSPRRDMTCTGNMAVQQSTDSRYVCVLLKPELNTDVVSIHLQRRRQFSTPCCSYWAMLQEQVDHLKDAVVNEVQVSYQHSKVFSAGTDFHE